MSEQTYYPNGTFICVKDDCGDLAEVFTAIMSTRIDGLDSEAIAKDRTVFLCKAGNAHDQLVAALRKIVEELDGRDSDASIPLRYLKSDDIILIRKLTDATPTSKDEKNGSVQSDGQKD